MQGFNAMWMPGIDHASIAVHVLLEKDLKRRENKTRFDLGRDEFLRRAWAWKERSGNRITRAGEADGLLARLAARAVHDGRAARTARCARRSCGCYEEGLIFRAKRMINWDPASETVVSDLEVDTVEENGSLWELRYPIVGGAGEIIVATTRPETMLGDTAVAVHPDDERYQASRSARRSSCRSPAAQIPIVADDGFVDPEFGSGAVKVTPAHDPNDYECSQRRGLRDPAGDRRQGPHVRAGAGEVRRHDRRRRAQGRGRRSRGRRRSSARSRTVQGAARAQPALRRGDRADADGAVVGQGRSRSPRRPSPRSSRARRKFVPEQWTKTYMHWMTQHPGLVHLAPAVVGPSHPGVVLRACGHDHRRARRTPTACSACGGAELAPGRGHPRHLVLARRCGRSRRSAGPTRRASSRRSIRTTSSSPAPTSSSSGSRA